MKETRYDQSCTHMHTAQRRYLSAADNTADDILTREDVAKWLKVKTREVARLGVPCLELGHRTKRYVRADVLAWLDSQRKVSSQLKPREAT